jgi:hypothetical protein
MNKTDVYKEHDELVLLLAQALAKMTLMREALFAIANLEMPDITETDVAFERLCKVCAIAQQALEEIRYAEIIADLEQQQALGEID